jgi:hypothetical protein
MHTTLQIVRNAAVPVRTTAASGYLVQMRE